MKRCPTCNKTFTDRNLSFCIDDGTPLLTVTPDPAQDETTVVTPSPAAQSDQRNQQEGYPPPGGYSPPGPPPSGQQGNRKAWPWVVGILALLLLAIAGLGIAAATFIPSMLRASNRNSANPPANANANVNPGTTNENLSGNSNVDDAGDVTAEETEPPTNESEVLSALTDLEHEWTVANINADKRKLNRILADDYVGTTVDGKTQGKADYLRTIERDTAIQKWEFEDLKVSLLGDRATLTGVLRLEAQNAQGQTAPFAFRFTDKFVWRANRWQAVSSVVTPEEIKQVPSRGFPVSGIGVEYQIPGDN